MKIEIMRNTQTGEVVYWVKVFYPPKNKVRVLCTDAKFFGDSETRQYQFESREAAEVAIATAMILGVL